VFCCQSFFVVFCFVFFLFLLVPLSCSFIFFFVVISFASSHNKFIFRIKACLLHLEDRGLDEKEKEEKKKRKKKKKKVKKEREKLVFPIPSFNLPPFLFLLSILQNSCLVA